MTGPDGGLSWDAHRHDPAASQQRQERSLAAIPIVAKSAGVSVWARWP
jgi:hypothetical protein